MIPVGIWRVGGLNDEAHHWFLFRYIDEDMNYECRDVDGNGVPRWTGKYVIYRTRREATQALRELKK